MKLRRTMMFVPGNNPGMIQDSVIYPCDCLMLDLEDSVALNQKTAARCLVREALSFLDFKDKEIVVRINDPRTAAGRQDLEAIVPLGKAVIRLPKTDSAEDIQICEQIITEIEKQCGLTAGQTRMMAAIEGPEGVLNAPAIAESTPRLTGIALGAEDYVTQMKTTRSAGGDELFFARSMILHAARQAGIAAIDTVYSDVNNEVGFRQEVELIHQLGFDGKSIINPRQIAAVHEIYTPSAKEIHKAMDVMAAIEEANRRGSGVISLKGKMIDKPIVERAQRTLQLARAVGLEVEEG